MMLSNLKPILGSKSLPSRVSSSSLRPIGSSQIILSNLFLFPSRAKSSCSTLRSPFQSSQTYLVFFSQRRFYSTNHNNNNLNQSSTHHQNSKPQTRIVENLNDISRSAKREAANSLGTVLDAVRGQNPHQDHDQHHNTNTSHHHQQPHGSSSEIISDLRSIGGLVQVVPKGAIMFGAAGLVPYFATSATTVYLTRQAFLSSHGLPARFDSETALTLLYHNESIQVAYGAVILSFLGAIHWGIEFAVHGMKASQSGGPSGAQRYWLGTLPVVLAWPTLLLPGQLALASQWAAFTVVWYADMLATGRGWTPRWYSTYRFGLTAVVGGCLIVTLAATNYWATDSSNFTSTSKKLQSIRDEESYHHHHTEDEGSGGRKIGGVMKKDAPIGSVSGEDAFVRITDVAAERREELAQAKREQTKEANKSK